jgi:hypothetical protein
MLGNLLLYPSTEPLITGVPRAFSFEDLIFLNLIYSMRCLLSVLKG